MLWECNKGSGNPEKQPLPVWSISGKPYVAGDRVNRDSAWSPPDNKVGGGWGSDHVKGNRRRTSGKVT